MSAPSLYVPPPSDAPEAPEWVGLLGNVLIDELDNPPTDPCERHQYDDALEFVARHDPWFAALLPLIELKLRGAGSP